MRLEFGAGNSVIGLVVCRQDKQLQVILEFLYLAASGDSKLALTI
jgi:hypothetical protein